MPKASPRLEAATALHGPNRREEAVLNASAARHESFVHDTASDAKANAAVQTFRRKLPANALVTAVYSQVLNAYTSAGGTATITLKAGNDTILSAVDAEARSGAESLLSSPVALSSAGELSLTIGGEDLTGGKVRYYIEYLLPNEDL